MPTGKRCTPKVNAMFHCSEAPGGCIYFESNRDYALRIFDEKYYEVSESFSHYSVLLTKEEFERYFYVSWDIKK